MKRQRWIWLIFGSCVVLVMLVMIRASTLALELERTEARTRRQAALDENMQLALWRMDSALAPLISEEGSRPYFTYTAFYPAERAYTHMFEALKKGDVIVASPLLNYDSPHIRLHFQFGPDGRLNSPQVPAENMRGVAEVRIVEPAQLERASSRLASLKRLVSEPQMALVCSSDTLSRAKVNEVVATFTEPFANNGPTQSRGSKEYEMRTLNTQKAQNTAASRSNPLTPSEVVSQGPMEAGWIHDALILGRRVRVGQETFLQGCWLDWEVIRAELLSIVIDLVPNATLESLEAEDKAPTRRLAALPARLVTPLVEAEDATLWSPVRLSLVIIWACLLITAGAIAILLGGTLALSERRGTFVSAVTHELRTPLTTFRLYTEMLAEGMIRDPATRDSYIQTLRTESDRLGHLVENVLSFAQIERSQSIDLRDILTASDLADRLKRELTSRAERGGMTLKMDCKIIHVEIRTDVSMVEQILANLVDNAAKYANGSTNRCINLHFAIDKANLTVTVRDHGPGLPDRAMRRLFRPFSKSALDAAHSSPGVGLGLALSRRLARALGGELRLGHNSSDGASFVLLLPIRV